MTVTQTDLHEWRNEVESCEWATFYEHPDWYEAWSAQLGKGVVPECWKVNIDNRRKVLIPLLKKRALKGMSHTYSGAPGGLYSGPISSLVISLEEANDTVISLAKKLRNLDIRLNPFWFRKHTHDTMPEPWVQSNFTQTIRLNPFDENKIEALQSSGVAYDARYANRKGVQIQLSDISTLPKFMDVYAVMLKKWGNVGTVYSDRFFESLISSSHSDFWMITCDDEYIGGGILLKSTHHVSSWLTIIHHDSLKLRPYEFTYDYLIDHYRQHGFTWFDFNPSAGLDGVVKFKEKFGTEILPFPEFSKYSGMIRLTNFIRGAF